MRLLLNQIGSTSKSTHIFEHSFGGCKIKIGNLDGGDTLLSCAAGQQDLWYTPYEQRNFGIGSGRGVLIIHGFVLEYQYATHTQVLERAWDGVNKGVLLSPFGLDISLAQEIYFGAGLVPRYLICIMLSYPHLTSFMICLSGLLTSLSFECVWHYIAVPTRACSRLRPSPVCLIHQPARRPNRTA